MAGAYSVAMVGFAENELTTFESFFRLAARRPPAYIVQDEVMDAQVLIVNADNAQALHLVRYAELVGKVLLIGHSDGGTGWPLQRKPVKLVGVLAALDELVGQRRPAPAHTPPVAPKLGADRAFAATEPYLSAQVPLAPAPRKRARSPDSEFQPTRPMTRSSAAPAQPPRRCRHRQPHGARSRRHGTRARGWSASPTSAPWKCCPRPLRARPARRPRVPQRLGRRLPAPPHPRHRSRKRRAVRCCWWPKAWWRGASCTSASNATG